MSFDCFLNQELTGEMKFSPPRLSIMEGLQLFHRLRPGFNSRPYKLGSGGLNSDRRQREVLCKPQGNGGIERVKVGHLSLACYLCMDTVPKKSLAQGQEKRLMLR
ncbi:unnamed protein product [Pleuronectes platessa]|uniref:Uncharacterized protein n=1 Tax=Pleuronectes platessa TaxID=8262 RepID=A0A9N7UWU3_PLEPL|nr:unnamed protein product [Pleuronectes platessa]